MSAFFSTRCASITRASSCVRPRAKLEMLPPKRASPRFRASTGGFAPAWAARRGNIATSTQSQHHRRRLSCNRKRRLQTPGFLLRAKGFVDSEMTNGFVCFMTDLPRQLANRLLGFPLRGGNGGEGGIRKFFSAEAKSPN